jgi:hypothetical protein
MYNLIKFQLIFNKSRSTLLIFSLVEPFKNFISSLEKSGGINFQEIWYILNCTAGTMALFLPT